MQRKTVVVGAGPAGLSAAALLKENGLTPLVVESRPIAGGISRTENYKGFLFDIGGHRFYTHEKRVQKFWENYLGEELLEVKRLSRIFYKGRFIQYPLQALDLLKNLNIKDAVSMVLSFLRSQFKPIRPEPHLEAWVTNRFGKVLYETFFREYTEKVWGIDCQKISSEWASQRIRNLTLSGAIKDAIFPQRNIRSLVRTFQYPAKGPGQLWSKVARSIDREGGNSVFFNTSVSEVHHNGSSINSVLLSDGQRVETSQVISSMPLRSLVRALRPFAPIEVMEALNELKHRSLILVGLILKRPHLFEDQWIYVHTPSLKVGRIQNYKNWSLQMVPESSKTSLGMEYFCSQGDAIWTMENPDLIKLAAKELEHLGLAQAEEVIDGVVHREAFAYPIYEGAYEKHLEVVKDYLSKFLNLQTVGRSAMHRYNNQDHSMLAGFYAAENILGARHDLWTINSDRTYLEKPLTKDIFAEV